MSRRRLKVSVEWQKWKWVSTQLKNSSAKIALELACPDTVSCADFLTAATHDPLVFLGRCDSLSSSVDDRLPKSSPKSSPNAASPSRKWSPSPTPTQSGSPIPPNSLLKSTTPPPPLITLVLLRGFKKAGADYTNNPTLSVFNDIMTPNKFDNVYFQNLPKGVGVLKSDHGLFSDPSTRPFVESFARDQDKFFRVFARAMQKLSLFPVKTAALQVLSYLPLPYSALSWLWVIPTPIRDAVYDCVAKHRYEWFGKAEDCLVLQ